MAHGRLGLWGTSHLLLCFNRALVEDVKSDCWKLETSSAIGGCLLGIGGCLLGIGFYQQQIAACCSSTSSPRDWDTL